MVEFSGGISKRMCDEKPEVTRNIKLKESVIVPYVKMSESPPAQPEVVPPPLLPESSASQPTKMILCVFKASVRENVVYGVHYVRTLCLGLQTFAVQCSFILNTDVDKSFSMFSTKLLTVLIFILKHIYQVNQAIILSRIMQAYSNLSLTDAK